MKVVEFISTFTHYESEKLGIKPYTIRDMTKRNISKVKGATHVRIRKGYTKETFTRKITSRLDWKDNIIIAWKT